MQCGIGNCGTCDFNGLHKSKWRHSTRATHTHFNVEQFGGDFLGWIFKSDCPFRGTRGETELLLYGKFIDFDDNAINFVLDIMAMFSIVRNELFNFFASCDNFRTGASGKTPSLE